MHMFCPSAWLDVLSARGRRRFLAAFAALLPPERLRSSQCCQLPLHGEPALFPPVVSAVSHSVPSSTGLAQGHQQMVDVPRPQFEFE